ncbi:lysozyme family protein [Enterococcus sp. LJL98]
MRRKKKKRSRKGMFFFFVLVISGFSFLFMKNVKYYQQVMALESEVIQKAELYGVSEYSELILSMILTESKGVGPDPMQSSESAYGEVGKMGLPEESIDQGVAYLANNLALAKSEGVDLWTAVQAYNFGLDYIPFVRERGGINTLDLAEEYSRAYLAPELGNTTQARYRYWRLSSLLYNGGYLYYDGGNIFYAQSVKWNEQKMRFFHFLWDLW